jgi:hypothetical protein
LEAKQEGGKRKKSHPRSTLSPNKTTVLFLMNSSSGRQGPFENNGVR